MQLLFLRHGRTSFATSEDDRLYFLRNRELRIKSGGGGLERGDTRSDMIIHPVLIKVIHLLLNSSINARIARVQTNHKNALIAKIHPRRRFLLTKAEMETLNDRLRTLQAKKGYAIPKGMDPNHPQKISRRAMRGR